METMPRHSGTDAYAMQVAAEGIPTMVIGIPLRYMHTPVEIGLVQRYCPRRAPAGASLSPAWNPILSIRFAGTNNP